MNKQQLLTVEQLTHARTALVNQRQMYADTGGGAGVLAALDKAIANHDQQIARLHSPEGMAQIDKLKGELADLETQLKAMGGDDHE